MASREVEVGGPPGGVGHRVILGETYEALTEGDHTMTHDDDARVADLLERRGVFVPERTLNRYGWLAFSQTLEVVITSFEEAWGSSVGCSRS